MAPALEEGKLDHLALIGRQPVELALEKAAQIGANQILAHLAAALKTGLRDLRFEAIFGPAIRLAATQAIDRPSSRQGYHPAQWSARFGGIISSLFPNLEKDFLQDIVRLRLFVHDAGDDGLESFSVPLVKLAQGGLMPVGDRLHQSLVRSFSQARGINQRLNHMEQRRFWVSLYNCLRAAERFQFGRQLNPSQLGAECVCP